MQELRFQVDDRVRTLQPIGWVNNGSYGTITRVFFGMDTYAVRFDALSFIRLVPGHALESIKPSPVPLA